MTPLQGYSWSSEVQQPMPGPVLGWRAVTIPGLLMLRPREGGYPVLLEVQQKHLEHADELFVVGTAHWKAGRSSQVRVPRVALLCFVDHRFLEKAWLSTPQRGVLFLEAHAEPYKQLLLTLGTAPAQPSLF